MYRSLPFSFNLPLKSRIPEPPEGRSGKQGAENGLKGIPVALGLSSHLATNSPHKERPAFYLQQGLMTGPPVAYSIGKNLGEATNASPSSSDDTRGQERASILRAVHIDLVSIKWVEGFIRSRELPRVTQLGIALSLPSRGETMTEMRLLLVLSVIVATGITLAVMLQ